jgi:uncharacterized protein (TIGR03067 family)
MRLPVSGDSAIKRVPNLLRIEFDKTEWMHMFRLLLPFLLGALFPGDEGLRPTDAEIQRAHEMLAGSWQFISINDKGEILGPRLVESRFARDGILTIADRRMTIANPVTGENRTATFRIDPSKNPRRIDLITRDDRLLRGIYKFEGDHLTLCLQPDDAQGIPADFSAEESSDLILIRLKAMPASTSSAVIPKSNRDLSTSASARMDFSARDHGPSESELRRAHELLAGNWNILSMTDDGEVLAPDLIRAKFAENGRVQIGTRNVAIISPNGGERRLSAIRLDPSKTPSAVDVTTQFDEVLKGIYKFDGDQLVVCLAKRDDADRPTSFSAAAGSGDLLFRLKMAPAQQTTAEPAPAEPRTASKPVDSTAERDEQIRKKIVGAWSLNDAQGNLTLVFRADGTFAATRTWRSGLKRLFEGDTTTSEGRWSYSRGLLDALVTSTMDPKLLAHNFNYWVQSVGDDTLVAKTLFGQLLTARRLR